MLAHTPTHSDPPPPPTHTHLDVDAAREEVGGDEVAAVAGAEVMEDAVAVRLQHLGVDVEARVAQFGDLLGQQLHAVDCRRGRGAG